MKSIKCIHKKGKGGCLQINPRYGRPYRLCNPRTCIGNPANQAHPLKQGLKQKLRSECIEKAKFKRHIH